jgi:hypothetical protein
MGFLFVVPLVSSVAFATPSIQPAIDLVSRNFGVQAADALTLSLGATSCIGADGVKLNPPCFSISQSAAGGKIAVSASGMSELTYGIGYYGRFSCGLSVGWKRGGGSHSLTNESWPCHGATKKLEAVAVQRAVPCVNPLLNLYPPPPPPPPAPRGSTTDLFRRANADHCVCGVYSSRGGV